MKVVNLEIHGDFLKSGKAEVVALKHSHILGYFLRGDKLKVIGVIGSMLRVKTVNGYTCLVDVNAVSLPNEHIETIHCLTCLSLYKDKHSHKCSKILVEA